MIKMRSGQGRSERLLNPASALRTCSQGGHITGATRRSRLRVSYYYPLSCHLMLIKGCRGCNSIIEKACIAYRLQCLPCRTTFLNSFLLSFTCFRFCPIFQPSWYLQLKPHLHLPRNRRANDSTQTSKPTPRPDDAQVRCHCPTLRLPSARCLGTVTRSVSPCVPR